MVVPILGFISTMSDLGIGRALVQPKSISQSQISALFWLNTMMGAAICLVLVIISPLVGVLYHEPKTVHITIALASLFFIGTLGIHPSAILNREMRLVRIAIVECIASILGLAVGILTAMNGYGYWALIYMQGATTVATLLMIWWSANWWPSWPRWDRSATRTVRFGASLTISNIAIYFSMTADNMIIGVIGGKVALALYDKAYRLVVSPLLQMSAPVGRVAIPLLSRLADEPERYARAFKRMIQLPNLVCVPGLIGGMFLSPQFVQVLLGPTWRGIAPVASCVCIGGLGSILYGSASWLFTSQGRGKDQMKWSLITSAISIASFVVGVRWGAVGVAGIGGAGFVLVQTPLMIRAATRTGPVSAKQVTDAIWPMIVALLFTAPTTYFFSKYVHLAPVPEICAGMMLTFAVYLIVISLMPSGRDMLLESATTLSSYFVRLRSFSPRTAVRST
jgi:PST family polysaccharide transporter